MRRFAATNFAMPSAIAAMTNATRNKAYSPKVKDHYKNPRNVGTMDESREDVGTATHGALECGDLMKMSMQINKDTQVIEDVKFKTFGCGSAIASSSYASEVIRGKTIAQAMELTNKDIAAELSLPPVKIHCSMLAEETIRAAISNYLQKQPQLKTKIKRGGNKTFGKPDEEVAPAAEEKKAEAAN